MRRVIVAAQCDFQPKLPRTLGEQFLVAQADEVAVELVRRDGEAKVRSDARGLAGGQRDSRQHGVPATGQPVMIFT